MKKTVAKSKAKPAKTTPVKSEPARKSQPTASTHDPMHSLLRGAHASKICR